MLVGCVLNGGFNMSSTTIYMNLELIEASLEVIEAETQFIHKRSLELRQMADEMLRKELERSVEEHKQLRRGVPPILTPDGSREPF
jgi:hypothetical protein